MKIKVSGEWKEVTGVYTKILGEWKQVISGYSKVNGAWKEIYQSCPYDARIAYLESTGTQMINSGISGGSNAGYNVNFQIVSGGVNYAHFFGSSRNETTSPKIYKSGSTTNVSAEWYTTSVNSVSPIFTESPNKIHNVRFYNGTLTYDGTSTSTGNLGFGSKPFCIFDYTAETGLGSKMKLYDCKVYLDGTLVRDFIPVRKGQVGYLYDKVSKKLFGNVGTGSFTLGSDIT